MLLRTAYGTKYAHLLAAETGDAQLAAISQAIGQAFNEAILSYADVNLSNEHLSHYTLSVCLYNEQVYTQGVHNICEGYELCDFHKLTGWGNWLRTNQQQLWGNPRCGGGGPIE